MTTPAELAFPADETVAATATLDADGLLKGHFVYKLRGDGEMQFRAAYNNTPPAQWGQLTQLIVARLGFGGTVSNALVENATNTDAALGLSYDYERKNYSGWDDRRILLPLPVSGLLAYAQMKARSSVRLGARGTILARAVLELPEGHSATIPKDFNLPSRFADYSMTYTVEGRKITGERKLVVKQEKVSVSQWPEFAKFVDAVTIDQGKEIEVVKTDGAVTISRDDPGVKSLIDRADAAVGRREYQQARELLEQAERLNPNASGLWRVYSGYYANTDRTSEAIEAMQRELRANPTYAGGYEFLAGLQQRAGLFDDQIETWKQWTRVEPENTMPVIGLAYRLIADGEYQDAIEALTMALDKHPGEEGLETFLLEAYLRGGEAELAAPLLDRFRTKQMQFNQRGHLASMLIEAGGDADFALTLAQSVAAEAEQAASARTLANLPPKAADADSMLSSSWETLGMALFHSGNRAEAEKYLLASFELSQYPATADLLGRLYERQGKLALAARYYDFALTLGRNRTATQRRLEQLIENGKADPKAEKITRSESPEAELSDLRAKPVPGFKKTSGMSEFNLLISANGVEDAAAVASGAARPDPAMEAAIPFLKQLKYSSGIPAGSAARVVRRGILTCVSVGATNCSVVFYLLEDYRH